MRFVFSRENERFKKAKLNVFKRGNSDFYVFHFRLHREMQDEVSLRLFSSCCNSILCGNAARTVANK